MEYRQRAEDEYGENGQNEKSITSGTCRCNVKHKQAAFTFFEPPLAGGISIAGASTPLSTRPLT
jgi:hypothetical protein